MTKRLLKYLLIGAICTPISLCAQTKWLDAKTSDNMSMFEYADKVEARLSAKATRITVDPDFTPTHALYRYYMPDGTIVRCTRGMVGYTFTFECKE